MRHDPDPEHVTPACGRRSADPPQDRSTCCSCRATRPLHGRALAAFYACADRPVEAGLRTWTSIIHPRRPTKIIDAWRNLFFAHTEMAKETAEGRDRRGRIAVTGNTL